MKSVKKRRAKKFLTRDARVDERKIKKEGWGGETVKREQD